MSRLTLPPKMLAFSVILGDVEPVDDSEILTGAITCPSTLSALPVCSSALVVATSPLVEGSKLPAAVRLIAAPVAPIVPTAIAPT